jgi:murein DD-endopeptidase MepM/ murein hydrolase activator NlpD
VLVRINFIAFVAIGAIAAGLLWLLVARGDGEPPLPPLRGELCRSELDISRKVRYLAGPRQIESGKYVGLVVWLPEARPYYAYINRALPPLAEGENPLDKVDKEQERRISVETVSNGERPGFVIGALLSFAYFDPASPRSVVGQYPVKGPSEITQVFGRSASGELSHRELGIEHAVDMRAPLGTEVVAYRDGTVVLAEDRYHDYYCDDRLLADRGNTVLILQDDGLEATYGHLKHLSLTVKEGDQVAAGQKIAEVGCSGWCDASHLHFHVGGITDSGFQTVPISFSSSNAETAWTPQLHQRVVTE